VAGQHSATISERNVVVEFGHLSVARRWLLRVHDCDSL
jgi:hypothetical protein